LKLGGNIMKKLLGLVLIMVLALSLLAGCGSSSTSDTTKSTAVAAATTATAEPTKSDTKPYRFTLVSPLVGHPYWVTVEDGMKAADTEFGVNTEYIGPTAISVDEQIKFMETAIASKVDGIITMALDPVAFQPTIDKAVAAGIPVVLIDTDAPKSNRNVYAGTSNKQAGVEAGKAMIAATGGKAVIGIITGAIDAANLNDRIDGFKEAIKDQPDMKIVATEPSDSDLLKGTEKAQSMLKSHPDINAFFGVSATDIDAAAKIIDEQKLTGKVKLVGFDDLAETVDYIKKGIVDATIVQKPFQMGYLGVKLLKDIKDGNAPTEKIIDTGVTVVTKDNVETYKNAK
jgi:ribose transport system substrate-binding protein